MRSLYRKYRPVKLEDVVGQEQVTEPLAGALKSGKISHAYLFIGPRGCGKTSVARILAHEINGFKYEIEDDYVDIIEIDGASNRGIDNIRELREKVAIAPTTGKYKVYIIDEVHMLTKEAFNALLKTLEEPPEHAVFIMATTDAYKVPVTITSRAQTYTFKLAGAETMFKHLKKIAQEEKIDIEDAALKIIVKRGGGSFRDSLSLLDQISTLSDKTITEKLVVEAMGLPEDEKIQELLTQYRAGDLAAIGSTLKELLSSGVKPEVVAEELILQIIAEPEAELIGLLAKLPEIKAPFAEAKLLVALSPRAGALRNAPQQDTKDTQTEKTSIVPQQNTDRNDNFNWGLFIERLNELNDAIATQAKKCKHKAVANELHLYPDKRITKIILSRDNNKKILIEAAGGYKIVFHEAGEKLDDTKEDALLSKISDIMGGEVTNDGGNSPF
ncbi:DNA polymerase III subunit gamma/tau [Candidatus Saccharibacteria bacterium]|nr:DNA polymerase III subunit gamma/tau [Candidatus Saccharibacteria bacterium]